jgi:hypothetical protein
MTAAVECRVLSDGWPDGPPEERVHVAVEAAPNGGAQAVRIAIDELGGWLEGGDLALVATDRRAWFRPSPCLGCDGSRVDDSGLWHGERLVGPAPACESCGGTGEECGPDDDDAVEFWLLELVEASA